MLTLKTPTGAPDRIAADEATRSITRGRRAAFPVAGFLAGLLLLNTYWGLGGTWGIGWVLGCADCTVPLSLVWVQEAMIGAGIVVLLARSGILRPPLPAWIWRSGTWVMAAAFGAVGMTNLFGDNTLQARLLFAPLALTLAATCTVAARSFARAEQCTSPPEFRQPAPPAPRWAQRAAALAVLTTVPSALWRMAMAVGIPVGASDQIVSEQYGFPGWGTVYVFGLSALLVGLALLTLGLVQRWGEVVPGWIPLAGGKAVPPLAAVVPAGVGALVLTLLWVSTFSNIETIWALYGLDGAERVLMMACYSPLLLWGPLLAAVTVSYHRRHRPGGRLGDRSVIANAPPAVTLRRVPRHGFDRRTQISLTEAERRALDAV